MYLTKLQKALLLCLQVCLFLLSCLWVCSPASVLSEMSLSACSFRVVSECVFWASCDCFFWVVCEYVLPCLFLLSCLWVFWVVSGRVFLWIFLLSCPWLCVLLCLILWRRWTDASDLEICHLTFWSGWWVFWLFLLLLFSGFLWSCWLRRGNIFVYFCLFTYVHLRSVRNAVTKQYMYQQLESLLLVSIV